jgi:LemA protein
MTDYFTDPKTQDRERFRKEYEEQQTETRRRERKSSMLKWGVLGGIILLILIVGGTALGSYNGLVDSRERVKSSWSQVENQMQRRADLIPNLVETVKGATKHEQEVFGRLADARAKLLQPNATPAEKVAANDVIDRSLIQVLSLQESYPQLRSNESFMRLQDELAGSENRISVARRDYINTVQTYNVQRSRFPAVIFANLLGFPYEENYFKAAEGAKEAPKVKF